MLFSSSFLIIFLVASISFLIGILRYSPLAFGRLRMHLSGLTHEDLENTKPRMILSYIISFCITLIKTYVLAHFILFLAQDVSMALQTGFWLRLWFVATTQLSETLWTHKPRFWLIGLNTAHQLIVMLISAYLLFLWL